MKQRIGVHHTGDDQDRDGHPRQIQLCAEQGIYDAGHQRRCQTEGGGGARQQGKDCQQVNDPSGKSVGVLSQNRTAGLGIPLPVPLPHMEHEAEGRSQHQIEGPGDQTPVKQREHPGPGPVAAQLGNVGIHRIEDPLGEGIEQDVRSQTGGEHHGAPGEEAVLGLLLLSAQHDAAEPGTGNVQRQQEKTQADDQIVNAEGIAQHKADMAQNPVGALRRQEEQDA